MACGSRTYVCPPPFALPPPCKQCDVACGNSHTHTHTHTHSGACVCTSIFTSITTSYNIKVCSMAYKKEAKDLPTYTYIHSRRQQTVGMCSRVGGGGNGDIQGTCQHHLPAGHVRPCRRMCLASSPQISHLPAKPRQGKVVVRVRVRWGEAQASPLPTFCHLFCLVVFRLFASACAFCCAPNTHTHSHRIG